MENCNHGIRYLKACEYFKDICCCACCPYQMNCPDSDYILGNNISDMPTIIDEPLDSSLSG